MEYFEAGPSPRLAGFIKCFWAIRSDVGSGTPEPVLPDGCPEIVFNLADPFLRLHADGSREIQPAAITSLFVSQTFDRIKFRGFSCGKHTEDQSDADGY